MMLSPRLETVSIADQFFEIFIPDSEAVYEFYKSRKGSAYWAQIWPAALGLCQFMKENPEIIANKKILELAAGLGLPGLFAAQWAAQVLITDIEPLATQYVTLNIRHLKSKNVEAATLDWNDAAKMPTPQLVLLSDVNYEPEVFDDLHQILEHFLNHKAIILLSTPERLVARQFINRLVPYISGHSNYCFVSENKETQVSVFCLQK